MTDKKKHGGAREGAGRKAQGKARYTITLSKSAVDEAKKKEANLSGLLDRLLADWLKSV